MDRSVKAWVTLDTKVVQKTIDFYGNVTDRAIEDAVQRWAREIVKVGWTEIKEDGSEQDVL